MKKILKASTLILLCASLAVPAFAQSPGETTGSPLDSILNPDSGSTDLIDQNVDPAQDLLDRLRSSSRQGPDLRVSPEAVFLSMEERESDSATVRILNVGDLEGVVNSINEIQPIDGLVVTGDDCVRSFAPGDSCDIAISYTSSFSTNILTSIVLSVEDKSRSSISVPLTIEVVPTEVEADPTPTPDPDQQGNGQNGDNGNNVNRPIVVVQPPAGPTDEEIARRYFSSAGASQTGPMSVVTIPDNLRRQEDPFLSGSADLLSVETINQDPRYDESIAYTTASLPVDRSMIITSDRVIKAVLETPFSNVMCGKVVAMVESDIYSATSQSPLIQAGSKVVGRCGTLVKERAGIVWERIVTVDGRSIMLDGEDSMTRDANGLGGALGHLYRTPYDRYVLPIFGTFVDVAAGFVIAVYGEQTEQEVDAEGNITETESPLNEGIQIATESVRNRAQETIAEMQDIREVMIVPAGTRIDIEIFEDIYFKNEREVVRLADTVYNVERPASVDAQVGVPDNLTLVPYRQGITGPVVEINGRRYVVQEGNTRAVQNLDQTNTGVDERPTVPNQGVAPNDTLVDPTTGRPDTQATLNDLRN